MNIKEILKYSIWVGICSVLVIPFIVASDMFFPYIVGKAFTFRIITEIIFGLWLILIIKDKEFRPKWSWVLGSVTCLVFVLLLADINAVAPVKAFWSNFERMEGWITFIHLFMYFAVLASMLNKEKLWLWFLRLNIFTGTILALISIDGATEARFSGPLGNPIYISVYFLFIFFFTLILMYKDVLVKNLTDWNLFRKVFSNILFYVYLAVSVLSLYVVYRTSRGALLGVIGGIFIAMILVAIFEKEKKIMRYISLGGIALIVITVIIFLGARNTSYIKNNPTLSRLAEISWSNINGQARQLIWPIAIKGFKEKPVLGWGQEGFNYVFNKYYDPRLYNQETWFDRAHNAPLDFLVAGGILGFLSYLALFGSSLYLLWLRRNPSDRVIRVGNLSVTEKSILTGVLGGYLFQAIFVFDNLVSYIMLFTVLAYIHSKITENEENKPAFNFMSGFVSDQEYQNYILIPSVIILTVVGVYFINIPGIRANKSLIQSFRLVQGGQIDLGIKSFKSALSYKSMGDSEIREQILSYTPSVLKANEISLDIKKDFLNLALTEVDRQISIVPNDARYYILTGSVLNNINNPELALKYINKAVELSPQKQAMRFELIQSLYMLGRKDEALIEAQKAYDLEPNYDQAKSIYEALLKEKTGK